MLITFASPELKERFIRHSFIEFQDGPSVVNDDDRHLMYLNVYDALHELSDDAISLRLKKFCSVITTRRGKYANSEVCNGIRHYRVRKLDDIPSYLRFGKFLIRLSRDGQLHTCRRCNQQGHFANECAYRVCYNCDAIGHESKDSVEDILCSFCKSNSHLARYCRFSWFTEPPRSAYPAHIVGSRPPMEPQAAQQFLSPGDPLAGTDVSHPPDLSTELMDSSEAPNTRILDSQGSIVSPPEPALSCHPPWGASQH